VFEVYCVSETAQVELRRGRVYALAQLLRRFNIDSAVSFPSCSGASCI